VDLIARYSNPPPTPVDLRKLLTETPDPAADQIQRPPRQFQRRLRAEDLAQLKADYLTGVPVIDLAKRYGIARQTVIERMRRIAVCLTIFDAWCRASRLSAFVTAIP
jgi:hypothetical protein